MKIFPGPVILYTTTEKTGIEYYLWTESFLSETLGQLSNRTQAPSTPPPGFTLMNEVHKNGLLMEAALKRGKKWMGYTYSVSPSNSPVRKPLLSEGVTRAVQ